MGAARQSATSQCVQLWDVLRVSRRLEQPRQQAAGQALGRLCLHNTTQTWPDMQARMQECGHDVSAGEHKSDTASK